MSRIHLETERISMREFERKDVPLLVAMNSDPRVMEYLRPDRLATVEEEENWIGWVREGYREHPGFGYWAAIEKAEDVFIGWFHLRPDREDATAMEIGYRLAYHAWGRGLATEGSLALLRKGVEEQGVTKVTGKTMVANRASAHVLEKLGLRRERTYREYRFTGADKQAVRYVRTYEKGVFAI